MRNLFLLFGVCVLWALGVSNTNAQVTVTHSSSQTIAAGNSVACSAAGISVDNTYSRSFVLSGFGITGTFNIDTVEFGIEDLNTTTGTHDLTITLSTTNAAYPGGTLTQLTQSTITLTDTALAIIAVPMTAAVPPGSELVVEVDFIEDTTNATGFFMGSNSLGESAPSYITAVGCGITTPSTFASIGFASTHIVINVKGTQSGGASIDASLIATTPNEYTLIPDPQQLASNPATATIQNIGSNSIPSGSVNTNVYLVPNLTTPVQTLTGSFSSLASGSSTTVSLTNYTPLAIGNYLFEHIVTVSGDANATNDTVYTSLGITGNEYARDNGSPTNAVGIGAGAAGTVGNTFQINNTTQLDSVLFYIAPGQTALGDTVQVLVSNVVAGTPQNTYIGQSAPYILTPADTAAVGTILVLPVSASGGGVLTLNPGNYFVGVAEATTMPNMGIQCTPEIYTPQTVYANINGGAYAELTNLVTGGFPFTPIVRPLFGQACTVTSTVSTIDETCTAADGSATASASGGATPYNYSWSNGGSTAGISNLAAGTYYVTITDNAGCSVIDSAVIGTNTITITNSNSSTDETCTASGTATVTASNGTSPYNYMWSNGQMTATATGLTGGTYNVTITDDNGCMGTNVVTVNSSAVTIAGTSSSTDASCGASDGSATVTASNGTSPYNYMWSDGQMMATATGLAAGSYDVTITDDNGCTGVVSGIVVDNPNAPNASATNTDINCFGDTDGSVSASATGGTGSYSYQWGANAGAATTATVSGLGAGTYTVTITDSLSCAAVATVTITGPSSAVSVTTSATDATAAGASDGTATATASGGTSPYTYVWSNGQTTAVATGLSANTYTVTATDDDGCSVTETVVVNDGPVGVLTTANLTYVNVYPNPTRGQAILEVRLAQAADLNIDIINVAGQVVQRIQAYDVIDQRFNLNMNNWAAGMYLIRVTTEDATSTHRLMKQ